MCEIVEKRSILGTCIPQWMAGTTERICAKFTRKTCLVLRSDEFECRGQKSKVKVTRDKNVLCTQHSVWNALVADSVAHAADTMIQSLQRGDFAIPRAVGLAGYRWALPRISSLVLFLHWPCFTAT